MTHEQHNLFTRARLSLEIEYSHYEDTDSLPNEMAMNYITYRAFCSGCNEMVGHEDEREILEVQGMRIVINNKVKDGRVELTEVSNER